MSENKEARDLFLAVLALTSAEEQNRYLDLACRDKPELRQRVEILLREHQRAGSFLDEPARPSPRPTVVLNSPVTEKAGDRIGRYKLLQQIGEGGCGVVYMAEQQEPIRRRVALKVIKLGMDTKQVIARFEAERQALALMDHPNIAKVLDAGATDTGRPYFVMELVRGVRITDYCDQNHLSTEQRLKLFVQVCHAVQHAHQKGVIHRDIKPSNIPVMLADDVPVPKMIDFGIAKAIGQKLTDKTVYTRFEQFIGTPAYMSPEQAGMSGLDVDTRSDIYSLGVLLYELLTGRTPFQSKELAQAGLDEMLRCIREEEPPKPSTRLSRLEQKEQTTTAQRRATEAPKLIRSLRGDLDWIVMKCLEKNRTRRYETANEVARDIEYHLNHQPVSAAAPTLGYRAAKYVRRHRRVLATAGAFAVLLIMGTTLSVWQARRAGQAEKERASLRKVRWALEIVLPQIERSLEKDDYTAAFKLVEQARPFIGDDPRFQALSARAVSVISIESTPAGAQVFLRDYRDVNAKWDLVGRTPLEKVRVPSFLHRWRITLEGYETVEGARMLYDTTLTNFNEDIRVTLDKLGVLPPGMVRIQGGNFKPYLQGLDGAKLKEIALSDYLLDRYEVSNRRFKEFVEAGGYQKPEYWRHKFVKDGRELTWAEAMKLFVDQTGRLGPATWERGDFPKGQEEYPVCGVSWYEAAAYAQWAGKSLPTLHHWNFAAVTLLDADLSTSDFLADVVMQSNFGRQGPAPAGKYQGVTPRGVYDLAGNAKEWCLNETTDGLRLSLGGGWNDETYMFVTAERYPPFRRAVDFGFRCMKLLTEDAGFQQAAGPVAPQVDSKPRVQKPCSDEVFEVYKKLYSYNKSTNLHAKVEWKVDVSLYTRLEWVSFDAAYGGERMTAALLIPRLGKPPFQTLIHFPSGAAFYCPATNGYFGYDRCTQAGRAWVLPSLHDTYHRQPPGGHCNLSPLEHSICWFKDVMRTIDYLETRPEFDVSKLAYEGASWGATYAPVLPALEPRFKAVVMMGGALDCSLAPEFSHFNFGPRVKTPFLIQNGRYDPIAKVASTGPLLDLLGTAAQDKQYKLYDIGHSLWNLSENTRDEMAFLDKYLGTNITAK
ncbi:MAG TPA: protein kinase [Candidatus Acidoferrum sp.]|nr:protein kinase [Candidatus Acidoferrum sp.]